MTLPFFGSGMVEIPPDGYKRMKNSRKMQMVFFVHEGKVTVDIEDVQFGMTKGGVWQVPRGESIFSAFFAFPLLPSPAPSFISLFVWHQESKKIYDMAVKLLFFTATRCCRKHARFDTHRLHQGDTEGFLLLARQQTSK